MGLGLGIGFESGPKLGIDLGKGLLCFFHLHKLSSDLIFLLLGLELGFGLRFGLGFGLGIPYCSTQFLHHTVRHSASEVELPLLGLSFELGFGLGFGLGLGSALGLGLGLGLA